MSSTDIGQSNARVIQYAACFAGQGYTRGVDDTCVTSSEVQILGREEGIR